MASESSSGGAASKGRAAALNPGRGQKRAAKAALKGTKAGIPFKSGFRTARGQAQFKARGGVNRALPGTARATKTKAKKAKRGK